MTMLFPSQLDTLSVHPTLIPAEILAAIAAIVPDDLPARETALNALSYLAIHNRLDGIAVPINGNGEPVICHALRSEMVYAAHNHSNLTGYLPAGLRFIDRLGKTIEGLAGNYPYLKMVGRDPKEMIFNPYVNFHLDLARSYLYPRLGPQWHEKMRLKQGTIQDKSQDTEYIRMRTWTFIREPLRVIGWLGNQSKPEDLVTLLTMTSEEIMDALVLTIKARKQVEMFSISYEETLIRKTAPPMGIKEINKYFEKNKDNKSPPKRRSKSAGKRWKLKIKELVDRSQTFPQPDDLEDLQQWPEGLHDLKTAEQHDAMLEKERIENHPPAIKRRLPRHYRAGCPPVENGLKHTPMPLKPVGYLRLYVNHLINEKRQTGLLLRCIADLNCHTGWDVKDILDIRVSHSRTVPTYLDHPTYFPLLNIVYYTPDEWIGWPKEHRQMAKLMASDKERRLFFEAHSFIREPVSTLNEFFVPNPLRAVLDEAIKVNLKSSRKGNFLLCLNGNPVTYEMVKGWTKDANNFFRLKPGDIGYIRLGRSTFEWAYTQAGLSPEQRYLVCGHIRSCFLMSMYYHRSTLAQYHANYVKAYNQVEEQIQKTLSHLIASHKMGEQGDPFATESDQPDSVRKLFERSSYSLGAWRCVRIDHAHKIIDQLSNDYSSVANRRKIPIIRHNTLARLLTVLLVLLLGVRDFELPRILIRHVDLQTGYITLDGKIRVDRRKLHPFLVQLLIAYLRTCPDDRLAMPGAQLLFTIDSKGNREDISTEAAGKILSKTATQANLTACADLYAWRHLFSMLLLLSNLPIEARRYWMRHEAEGAEYDNGYLPEQEQEFEIMYIEWCNSIIQNFNLNRIWPGPIHAHA